MRLRVLRVLRVPLHLLRKPVAAIQAPPPSKLEIVEQVRSLLEFAIVVIMHCFFGDIFRGI